LILNKRQISCHLFCQAVSPLKGRAVKAGVGVFPMSMRGEIDLVASFRILSEFDIKRKSKSDHQCGPSGAT
jgi:hypothetical protein